MIGRMSTSGAEGLVASGSWASVNNSHASEYAIPVLRTRSNRTLPRGGRPQSPAPRSENPLQNNVGQWRVPSPC